MGHQLLDSALEKLHRPSQVVHCVASFQTLITPSYRDHDHAKRIESRFNQDINRI